MAVQPLEKIEMPQIGIFSPAQQQYLQTIVGKLNRLFLSINTTMAEIQTDIQKLQDLK